MLTQPFLLNICMHHSVTVHLQDSSVYFITFMFSQGVQHSNMFTGHGTKSKVAIPLTSALNLDCSSRNMNDHFHK